MSSWERFGDWIATAVVASIAWVSSLVAPGVAVGSVTAIVDVPAENQLSSVMRWAQQDDAPPIEQVGEGTGEDVETLDEAAPPADEVDTAEDVELLDQGPVAGTQEDVELLDQGSPLATVSEPLPPPSVSTIPETTFVAPAASSAPMVPEGFGTGNVHVATGSAGFPVGLEDCHVGAVTGRAFVGIDCGERGGSSFVGHAPSFEDFPFVLDENFPFDRESVFADRSNGQSEDNVQMFVSAAHGAAQYDNAAAPAIRTSGASSVEFKQQARDRKPRVETANDDAKRGKKKHRGRNDDTTVSQLQDAAGNSSADSKRQKKDKGKDGVPAGSARHDQKESGGSNDTKKHGGNKGKKNRASKRSEDATDND